MTNLKTSLKTIIGRVDKVKIVRSILEASLLPYGAFLFKFFTELKSFPTFSPILLFVAVVPIVAAIFLLFSIHKIDAWEDTKANERHVELVSKIDEGFANLTKVINELVSEIRKDRDERSNPELAQKRVKGTRLVGRYGR